jgi:hypothetical protein
MQILSDAGLTEELGALGAENSNLRSAISPETSILLLNLEFTNDMLARFP